ncbi:hypothetical protein GUJ93_ZPchr0012g19098 [Zizania palustris]|uniref:non-specific serine/threonine protein kinase n=1 Tax=Zizania palustris TaxID=103762 RepID=A0A8J5WIP6_ZIZPA|nr:hypothetical protein GUJ93_ZPchr0012g19098 [Zizania palustris]
MSPASIALLGYLAVLSILAHCLFPSSAEVDFIYNDFHNAANLSLDGSATVLRDGALQLTNDSNKIMGHAFFDSPVQMVRGNAVVSFSTAFVFDIVTVGSGGGHGLAFVVSASKVLPGATAEQYLGLLGKNNMGNSSNHVFAVEFDTVQANGLLNETDGNHVGVDLNSLVSNVSEPARYFTDDGERNVTLESAEPIQAWVDYDGGAKILNVTIAPVTVPTRPRRPLISHAIDLLPIFKQDMYVGFSASTGKLAISSNGTQGMREFVAEVASLGRMRHRNLVELRGWCKRGQDLLLVYEFMPNGSLDALLFGRSADKFPSPATLLTWEQRMTILKGVASGLVYLHEEWEQVVVHRDVKASNVLLGADMGAHLGDFGLARLYEHGADPATTRIVGTLGYMPPELTVTGKATRATDVFAYGTLLLETACGRRPIDPVTGVNLLRWVRDHGVRGELVHAVDERLAGCYDNEAARLVLWLGLMCSQARPETRPSMRQVCQYLDGEEDIPEEAVLLFSDADTVDFGSLTSLTWSSCATMSVGSLHGGR